jgi:dihydrofolate reductase
VGSTQYYLAQSLDGYIAEIDAGLDWLLHYEGDSEIDSSSASEGGYDRFFANVGALAMGSTTYEILLAEERERWPYGTTPCWVFTSRQLPVMDGADVRFARGQVGPVHEQMRVAAADRNVWIVGGGKLAMQFAEQDLLDELVVTIVPVVLGEGIPIFPARLPQYLRLTGVRPNSNGMVEITYDVVR